MLFAQSVFVNRAYLKPQIENALHHVAEFVNMLNLLTGGGAIVKSYKSFHYNPILSNTLY